MTTRALARPTCSPLILSCRHRTSRHGSEFKQAISVPHFDCESARSERAVALWQLNPSRFALQQQKLPLISASSLRALYRIRQFQQSMQEPGLLETVTEHPATGTDNRSAIESRKGRRGKDGLRSKGHVGQTNGGRAIQRTFNGRVQIRSVSRNGGASFSPYRGTGTYE